MKTSDYLIIQKHEKKECYIALNGISGSIDYISNQLGEKLSQGTLVNLSGYEKQYLEERGYIVKDEFDEKQRLCKIADIIHNKNMEKYRLSIAPTLSCNFACPYCFEQIEYKDSNTLRLCDIDEMFDAVDNASLPFSPEVFLFGGEPLMEKNREIISYIFKHCQKRGMRLYGTTNGYELDAFRDLLGVNRLNNLQISIDGIGEQHDKTRKHKDGHKTFNRIVANIDYCLNNNVRIIARSNLSKDNLSVAKDLLTFYEEKGWIDNCNFTYSFSPVVYCEDSLSYMEFYNGLKEIGIPESVLLRHVSIYLGITNRLNNLVEKEKLVIFQPEKCSSCYNSFFVAPDRSLYTCGDLLQSEKNCGKLSNGRFVFNETQNEWNSRYIVNMTKCIKCAYSMFCGGGCPARCIRNKVSIYTSLCYSYPQIFNKCLVNICSDMIPSII